MWASEKKKAELEQKERFALACLRNGDDFFKAALEVFGQTQGGLALRYAALWADDPYVLERKAVLREEKGEEAFLPTKVELARKILNTVESAMYTDDKLKGFRLYAELMGHIVKDGSRTPSGTINVNLTSADAKL